MKKLLLLITFFLSITNIYAWNIYNTSNSGLPSNNVRAIDFDKLGNVWIATDSGLVKYNGLTWQVYNTSNSGIPTNNIIDIKIDSRNIKWMTTPNSLLRFNDTLWQAFSFSNPSRIYIDNADLIFLILGNNNAETGSGFAIFNGVNTQIINTSNSSLVNNNVKSIYVDASNKKWISYDNNSYSILDTNGIIQNYNNPFPTTLITKIRHAPNGDVFFLSMIGNQAVISVKTDTGWYVHTEISTANRYMFDFEFDENGDFYAGCNLSSVLKYNHSSKQWINYDSLPFNFLCNIKSGLGYKWWVSKSDLYNFTNHFGLIKVKCINNSENINDKPINICLKDSVKLKVRETRLTSLWINTKNQFYNNTNSYYANDTGSHKLYWKDSNGCSSYKPQIYYVNKNFNSEITANPLSTCLKNNQFKLSSNLSEDSAGSEYIWDLVKKTSNLSNPSISYDSSGVFKIKLIAKSIGGCIDTAYQTLTVNANPTAGPMLGETNALSVATPYIYTVAQQPNHTYNWVVTNGIIAAGQGTNAATVQWLANGKGSLKVEVTNTQGCSDTTLKQVTVGNVGLYEAGNINSLVVYPNPSNGAFTVSLNALKSSTVQMSLTNLLGQEIWSEDVMIKSGEQNISLQANLSPGMYTLRLAGQDDQIQQKVIIK